MQDKIDNLQNVKNYILHSIIPSNDAQEIAKCLDDTIEILKSKKDDSNKV